MIDQLTVDYRASLVLLACAVAFIGTHAAVSMSEQFRLALSTPTNPIKIYGMLVLVSLSLGGVAFSGTQYIVFQSLRLRTFDNKIITLQFDPYMVLGSALVASFLTFVSILVASKDECFNKSQTEIMNIFITRESPTHTLAEIRQMSKTRIITNVCIRSLGCIIASGIIAGGAICLSRYMGVLSVQFPGTVEYDDGMVATSIILSMAGIISLYWIFFRILSVFPSLEILRTLCSVIGMTVIACVHYIRVINVKFLYNTEKLPLPRGSEDSVDIFLGVLTSAVLFSFLLLSFALSDLRTWLQRTSTQLYQADRALLAMINRPNGSVPRTPPTMSTMATARDSIRVKEASMQLPAPPEVVSYARQYLKRGHLSASLARQVSPPATTFIQSHPLYYDIDTDTQVLTPRQRSHSQLSQQQPSVHVSLHSHSDSSRISQHTVSTRQYVLYPQSPVIEQPEEEENTEDAIEEKDEENGHIEL